MDNAGKTTTLYKLLLGEVIVSQPTVGSNVEQIPYKNLIFEIWDLGGQANLRSAWAAYLRATDAVIMVVDSTDRARVGISKVLICCTRSFSFLFAFVQTMSTTLDDSIEAEARNGTSLFLHKCLRRVYAISTYLAHLQLVTVLWSFGLLIL